MRCGASFDIQIVIMMWGEADWMRGSNGFCLRIQWADPGFSREGAEKKAL